MHLVGYLYNWQMGFNSLFKGLNWKHNLLQVTSKILMQNVRVWDHRCLFTELKTFSTDFMCLQYGSLSAFDLGLLLRI